MVVYRNALAVPDRKIRKTLDKTILETPHNILEHSGVPDDIETILLLS